MQGFLAQLAENLYERYGDEISSLNIVFPSRRAKHFFTDALSVIVARPVWQPLFPSIDEIAESVAGLRSGDRVRLVTELYKVYSRYHDEPFDSFYFWGEILLNDFDSIDKYLIDADMLFANVADLKAIENNFDFLTAEQREVIARFWCSFGEKAGYSDEQQRFMSIWSTLGDIYHEYKQTLVSQGLAYTGMVYRQAVELIRVGQVPVEERRRYVIAGFNALSECEKVLFDYLDKSHDVEFFWDYDRYYLDDTAQEAGLFLRENIRRFPQSAALPYSYDEFSTKKNIKVIAAPSDSLQCKYVAEFLNEVKRTSGAAPGKETAVILTDEDLLTPVLYAIPSEVDKINVTMGYPLRLTLAYSFVERLITLRSRSRIRGGVTTFYHEDVRGLLNHPYMAGNDGLAEMKTEIADAQQVYVDMSAFSLEGVAASVFGPAGEGWTDLTAWLREVIPMVAVVPAKAEGNVERRQRLEFFSIISENIDKLVNSLDGCGIALAPRTFTSLLRRVLQQVRVPYKGEPLQGVQVMGILETRNLDFENVLLLSLNDDTFPGNRASSPSFIPHNLRLGYGLPTPQHHEGVWAYYFYRLLQRAANVHLVYSSHSDERSSGEPSRYIYQLEYESPHQLVRHELSVSVNVAPCKPLSIAKDAEIMARLGEFCREGGRTLSPTAFFNYVQCPLKFYFHSVARLRPEEEVSEEVEAPMFGTILHRAMELLYAPLIGDPAPSARIAELRSGMQVEQAVDRAIREKYFRDSQVGQEDYAGNLLLVRDIIIKYINTCILPFDATQQGLAIQELEKRIEMKFGFVRTDGRVGEVWFGGVCDRVDRLADGSMRIVDYKTGSEKLIFKDIESLFSQKPADQNAAALQTMTYAMMLNRRTGRDVQPALYYVRAMNRPDYSPLLENKAVGVVVSYIRYKDEFEGRLSQTLSEIFDLARPFDQCSDSKPCRWCEFNEICKR